MELVDATCFPGLSPAERRQQMYQAFYNWAADDLLLDPACFPGSQDQGADIFAALATQGGTTTAACFNGLPPNLQSWAVYEAVYDSAGDDSLTDPTCFAGLAPDEQQQALYAALYSIAGDDTLTDPACFLGLPPELREQAMFGAAFAVSEGQLTLDGVTNLEVTDDLNGGWSADWDDVAGADYYQIQVIGYSSTTSATSDETGSLSYGNYTLRVRPRDNDGNRGPWVSEAFTMVTDPVNTVAPEISGSTAPGSLLTTTNGTWTGGGSLTYSYQWKKNGVNVGADQNTYTTTGAVNGDDIQVVVTATNAAGSTSANSNVLEVVGASVYYTSEYAANDADINTGGGTDDTAAIQALLDIGGTEESPLEIRHDGVARVSGLVIGPHTTFRGWGVSPGLYQTSGSNKPIIQNEQRLTHAGDHDAGIVVKDMTLNGNGANQTQTEDGLGAYGTFTVCMWLGHVDGVEVRDINFINTRTFALLVSDTIGGATIDGIDSQQDTPDTFQDIVHLWGPLVGATTITNISGNTGDDMVAVNIDEMRTVGRALEPYESYGDALDPIIIDGVVGTNANQGIRLLSIVNRMEDVTVTNVSGTFGLHALTAGYGLTGGGGTGNFGSITIDGVTWAEMAGTINWHGNDPFTNGTPNTRWNVLSFDGTIDSVSIANVTVTNTDDRPVIYFGDYADIGSMDVPLELLQATDDFNYETAPVSSSVDAGVDTFTADGVITLDGVTQGVQLPAWGAGGKGDFTFTGWVKIETTGTSTIVGQWGKRTGGDQHSWVLYVDPDEKLTFLGFGLSALQTAAGSVPDDNTWRFVALRVDETANTAEIRLEGGSWQSISIGSNLVESQIPITLGLNIDDVAFTPVYLLDGSIGNITIHRSKLSDGAVDALYAAGNPDGGVVTDYFYKRPGGTDNYLRPGGVDTYIRP